MKSKSTGGELLTSGISIRRAVSSFLFGLIFSESSAYSQGCMPAGFMAPSLAAKGLSILKGGQWEAAVYYRYLESADPYIGDDVWEEGNEIAARNWIHSIDLEATYLQARLSLSGALLRRKVP